MKKWKYRSIQKVKMKELVAIFLVWVISIGCNAALAEDSYISVADLPNEVREGWHASYNINGDTLNLDIDIIVPIVDKVPIIRISQYIPTDHKEFQGVEITGNEIGRFVAEKAPDPMDSPSRDIGQNIQTIQLAALYDNEPYAEDNLLTFGEVKALANSLVVQFGFDDCDFDFDRPYDLRWNHGYGLLVGRLQKENKEDGAGRYTGEPYGEKGFYFIAARQRLHGVSIWTDIRSVYKSVRAEAIPDIGMANVSLDSSDGGYSIGIKAAYEDEMLCEDIPLCPFEKVKAAYEAEIIQGHIQQADQLVFAYVYFRDSNQNYVCYPCWILRCQYTKDPIKNANSKSNLAWQDTESATMLVVNAQTGELIDLYDKGKHRDRLPEFLTWEEVR